jgi:hypothetical protein
MMFLYDYCGDEDLAVIIRVIKAFYGIIQIGVPIILLVIGTVDLGKAVMAGDEKEIKAATGMLMKRAGAAVGVFLLVYIVQFLTGLLGGQISGTDKWENCWKNPGEKENNNQKPGETDNDEKDKPSLRG